MLRITRAIEFSASLRYRRADLSEEENRRRFGPRASHHGHNYRLEVTIRGEPDPASGMVLDLKDLNDLLEREVMSRFDHRDVTLGFCFHETRTQFFVHTNPPRRTGCDLFAGDEAVVKPSMHRGSRDPKDLCRFL